MPQTSDNDTTSPCIPPYPPVMDKVFAIGTSFMGMLTPAAKRRRTITTTTTLSPSDSTPTAAQPTSHRFPGSAPSRAQEMYGASSSQKYRTPPDNRPSPYDRSSHKRRREDEGIEDYVDSENSSVIAPEDSASNIARYDDDETVMTAPDSEMGHRVGNGYKRRRVGWKGGYSSEEEVLDEVYDGASVEVESEVDSINLAPEDEQAIAEEANPNEEISREELFAKRRSNIDEARNAGWHKDEINIYARLTMRGFEPLMPTYWWKDFRTCPSNLFSDRKDEWVIYSQNGNEYRGIKTLMSLTTLGGRVRDALLFRKSPEQVMKKEYDAAIKWAERDGGYSNMRFIPLLVNLAADRSQPVELISKSIIDQMGFLAVRYRQFYGKETEPGSSGDDGREGQVPGVEDGKLPLLYGIVAANASTVFVTMDPEDKEANPRTIAEFDFSDPQMDVWNGIAILMIICFVRDRLVAIKEAGGMVQDEVVVEDVDA